MFLEILKIVFNIILSPFIFLYLIFVEFIWSTVKRIYKYLEHLRFHKKAIIIISSLNRYLVLIIFFLPFIISEAMGLFSFSLFANSQIILGSIIYIIKIPIALLAFSIFSAAKNKILSFKLVKIVYDIIMYITIYIKQNKYYHLVKEFFLKIKMIIKFKLVLIKDKVKLYLCKIFFNRG